jgi:hypothetical protein
LPSTHTFPPQGTLHIGCGGRLQGTQVVREKEGAQYNGYDTLLFMCAVCDAVDDHIIIIILVDT